MAPNDESFNAEARSSPVQQGFRFIAVGVAATALHVIVFGIGTELLGLSGLAANAIAFATAFLVSFLGHFHWTFGSGAETAMKKADWKRPMIRFAVVALAGFAMNSGFAWVIVDLGLGPWWIAAALMATATPLMTFVLSRQWAFAKGDPA